MEELSRFHLFGDDDLRGSLVAEPASGLSGSALRAVALGERPVDEPLRFRRGEGSEVRDVMATTWIIPFLISPEVVRALDGFTGWDRHPARSSCPTAAGRGPVALTVSGRSGPIDDSLSER